MPAAPAARAEPVDDKKISAIESKRFQRVPIRYLLPNLLTLLALCSGVTAIRLAVEGRIELAVSAIILAAVLDGLDGRFITVRHFHIHRGDLPSRIRVQILRKCRCISLPVEKDHQ